MGDRKVSLVIPTLDRTPFLRELLDHVLAHRALHEHLLEIIVVDASATCSALHVLLEHPNLLVHFIRYIPAPCAGVSEARNTGARAARGEVIFFLDDDTIPDPACIDVALRALERDEADVVACKIDVLLR